VRVGDRRHLSTCRISGQSVRTLIGNKRVDAGIEHPLVRAVTVTGQHWPDERSRPKRGAMLKKTVLELGGSDPILSSRCGPSSRQGLRQGPVVNLDKLHRRQSFYRRRRTPCKIRAAVCRKNESRQDGRPVR
jgi:hypothetical protein